MLVCHALSHWATSQWPLDYEWSQGAPLDSLRCGSDGSFKRTVSDNNLPTHWLLWHNAYLPLGCREVWGPISLRSESAFSFLQALHQYPEPQTLENTLRTSPSANNLIASGPVLCFSFLLLSLSKTVLFIFRIKFIVFLLGTMVLALRLEKLRSPRGQKIFFSWFIQGSFFFFGSFCIFASGSVAPCSVLYVASNKSRLIYFVQGSPMAPTQLLEAIILGSLSKLRESMAFPCMERFLPSPYMASLLPGCLLRCPSLLQRLLP